VVVVALVVVVVVVVVVGAGVGGSCSKHLVPSPQQHNRRTFTFGSTVSQR
jgi:hypothetical protein